MKSSMLRLWMHLGFALTVVIIAGVLLASNKTGSIETIDIFTGKVGKSWFNYAVTVAAVGTLSMALLEAIKGIGDLRHWFHVWKLRQWICQDAAYEDLLFLAIGDRARTDALCAQPLEKMMGQIQAAANVALDFPGENKALYTFLTTSDISRLDAVTAKPVDRANKDREQWALVAQARRNMVATEVAPTTGEMQAAQARIRLANLISRKLDAFQLRTQYYWERANQLGSIFISVLIIWYALGLGTEDFTLRSLAFGVIAGLVSPFAKDLATSLGQFANK